MSQSFELEENDTTENNKTQIVPEKVNPKVSAPKAVIKPRKKLNTGKAINKIQAKTDEFIERGDSNMISYYIGSIEKIINTYGLDINESATRASLSMFMAELRQNNQHACATILKNKYSL